MNGALFYRAGRSDRHLIRTRALEGRVTGDRVQIGRSPAADCAPFFPSETSDECASTQRRLGGRFRRDVRWQAINNAPTPPPSLVVFFRLSIWLSFPFSSLRFHSRRFDNERSVKVTSRFDRPLGDPPEKSPERAFSSTSTRRSSALGTIRGRIHGPRAIQRARIISNPPVGLSILPERPIYAACK